jgi:N-acetylglucosamine repressor
MDNSFVNPSLLSISKIQNRGSNSESVLNQNRRLILHNIKDAGVISRKKLTEITGLKLATVTIAIKSLQVRGLIEEVGLIEGDMGRRIMGFSMSHEKFAIITIRMSPNYLKIASSNLKNENLYIKKTFLNTFLDIDHTCNVIVNEIKEVRALIKDRTLIGIALGVEGPFEIVNGYYKYPDPQSPDGYFDIGKVLNEHLNAPVVVNRQSNFAVYHLWKQEGKSNPLGTFVYISVSYTVECGIIINGEIINGSRGTVGHLDHIVIGNNENGNPKLLKDYASSISVIKRVKNLLRDYPSSILVLKIYDLEIRDIIRAFSLNDELAVKAFVETGKTLGILIANIESLLNPDYIFVGDELPTTLSMKKIIIEEAMRHLPSHTTPNVFSPIFDNEHSPMTKDDPSLLGANSYMIDAFIQSMEFGD